MKDFFANYSWVFYGMLILFLIYFLYRFFAPYFVRITNIFYVSGGPGTGKDVLCVDYAIKRYKLALRKWKIKYVLTFIFKHKKIKDFESKPVFYSTIPVLISYGIFGKGRKVARELELDVILLKKRLPNGSIVYISDINRFLNQHAYSNENIKTHVAEFISEFRQYTRGGYFIANSQSSDQVVKEIRMTFGKVRNNLAFHKFLFFYRIEGRTITISEGVLNVEQGDADKKNVNMSYIYGYFNPFIQRYDTYAYYGRVADMLVSKGGEFPYFNNNNIFRLPEKLQTARLLTSGYGSYKKVIKLKRLKMFLTFLFGTVFAVILGFLINFMAFPFIFFFLYFLLVLDAYL